MESRRNGPQLSSRHDDDDDTSVCHVLVLALNPTMEGHRKFELGLHVPSDKCSRPCRLRVRGRGSGSKCAIMDGDRIFKLGCLHNVVRLY